MNSSRVFLGGTQGNCERVYGRKGMGGMDLGGTFLQRGTWGKMEDREDRGMDKEKKVWAKESLWGNMHNEREMRRKKPKAKI